MVGATKGDRIRPEGLAIAAWYYLQLQRHISVVGADLKLHLLTITSSEACLLVCGGV